MHRAAIDKRAARMRLSLSHKRDKTASWHRSKQELVANARQMLV